MLQIPYTNIPETNTIYKEEILQIVSRVIESGDLVNGSLLHRFEQEMAKYLGVRHVIGVSNGTAALYLGMRALGIGIGDEVVTVANSYLASVSSIALTGATPVIVDVNQSNYNIDPKSAENAISRKTKAIIGVHLCGNPCNIKALTEICRRRDLFLIEDAAQAIGATSSGKACGTFGDFAAFSLHPLKNIGVLGDGGFIATNNEQLADFCSKARSHGHTSRDDIAFWSHNMRFDSLQAGVASLKLKHLDEINLLRSQVVEHYRNRLSSISEIKLPALRAGDTSANHLFMIRSQNRDSLKRHLSANGIETKIHYPIPSHQLTGFIGRVSGVLPNTEMLSAEILSLPITSIRSNEEIDYICNCIASFYQ